jgi:histidinol dehydrogenase
MSAAFVSAKGLRKAARDVSAFARAESFAHHALSVERRLARATGERDRCSDRR